MRPAWVTKTVVGIVLATLFSDVGHEMVTAVPRFIWRVSALPRDRRSLGLGILASANALGDLGSSIFVGVMLAAGHHTAAFLAPAGVGALGVAWMWMLNQRFAR